MDVFRIHLIKMNEHVLVRTLEHYRSAQANSVHACTL
jgi:hypothetical protein